MTKTKLSTYELVEKIEKTYIALRLIEFNCGKIMFSNRTISLRLKLEKYSSSVNGSMFQNTGVFLEHFYEMFESFDHNLKHSFSKYSHINRVEENLANYFLKGSKFVCSDSKVFDTKDVSFKNGNVILDGETYHFSKVRRVFSKSDKESILNVC
jgi:hypothetical protein